MYQPCCKGKYPCGYFPLHCKRNRWRRHSCCQTSCAGQNIALCIFCTQRSEVLMSSYCCAKAKACSFFRILSWSEMKLNFISNLKCDIISNTMYTLKSTRISWIGKRSHIHRSILQIYVYQWRRISREGNAEHSRSRTLPFQSSVLFRINKFREKQQSDVDTNRFLCNTSAMIRMLVKVRLPFPATSHTFLLYSDSVKNSTLHFFYKCWTPILSDSYNKRGVVEFSLVDPVHFIHHDVYKMRNEFYYAFHLI